VQQVPPCSKVKKSKSRNELMLGTPMTADV